MTMTVSFDSVLAFFRAELSAVQFPGLDAKVLDGASARIQAASEAVRRAEAELDAARAVLAAAEDEALKKAERALAYARIYAQDDATLLARLDALAAPTPPAPAPRRRGRPPKSATPLFAEREAAEVDVEASEALDA